MKYYNGMTKKPYFEGWYFKHSSDTESIAAIVGISCGKDGEKTSFIQIVTDKKAFSFVFPYEDFYAEKDRLFLKIGENEFSDKGIILNLRDGTHSIHGKISYGDFTRVGKSGKKYSKLFSPSKADDIMGPFSSLGFLECYHAILSMRHTVTGSVDINGKVLSLNGMTGYSEKNWGSSFPKNYTWLQCNRFSNNCSLFTAIADIPVLGFLFKGLLASFILGDKEYRFATYNGAKVIKAEENCLHLKHKTAELRITIAEGIAHPLKAPDQGQMSRIIRESVNTSVFVLLIDKGKCLYSGEGKSAGFEAVKI